MGQKALLKSLAQSHGIKTFAGFFRETVFILQLLLHIFRQIDGINLILANFGRKIREIDEIFREINAMRFCKAF